MTSGVIMDMDMRRAIRPGVRQRHVTLKSLVQISRLRNVDGNPTAVRGLFGVNVIAGQRPERRVQGMNLVLILLARLPGPTDEWGRRPLRATTEQLFQPVHLEQGRPLNERSVKR